ncbi:hypothetical protein CAEBREN_20598 [Caenorhabditis brenneri]|uniref:Transmembrane protein n=1 Tax=Caenorhabditis brenneri TaxID=135651 RepID=G0MAR1_CAEBE|nr:hypothetical protein CAEBREN_20598 [Caenorhabditis brenneri]
MVQVGPYSSTNRISTISSGVARNSTGHVLIKVSDKAPKMCCGRFKRRTVLMVVFTFTMFGLVALVGCGASLVKYI